jgi:tetratricopeptide (TPR) repeat protein
MAFYAALLAVSLEGFAQQAPEQRQRADAAYRAGQAALARQDLEAAQAEFEKVVHLAPTLEQGHSALGSVLVRRGQPKEAIDELERALAIQKTDSIAGTNLALAYMQLGELPKALATFATLEAQAKTQKRLLPSYLLSNYARALAAAGRLDEAAARMKAAIQADPRDPRLHDDLGSIYAQQKQWSEAQKEFAAALRINSLRKTTPPRSSTAKPWPLPGRTQRRSPS